MAQRNLITDVAGVLVGHADDVRLASGVTVIVFEEPAVAAVDVRGGAPGTREPDLLEPHRTVERIDGVVLSGGWAFGLDAGAGVQAFLRERGRGFAIGDIRVPLVCGAVLFDLLNGGDKNWGRFPPYRDLGYAAASAAARTFALGTAGAGVGATTLRLKGGRRSAAARTPDGRTAGGLVKAQAKELAVIAQDGLARAIYPVHTTLDGDTVFAAATGRRPLVDAVNEVTELGAIAANALARAVARAVFEAKALPGGLPSWQDCHS